MATIQRMTRQRQAVLDVLQTLPNFSSAGEVHKALQTAGEPVSLATVYRNLQTLTEMGRLDSVHASNGESLYRLCESTGHHHHVVCEVCSRVEEINLGEVEALLASVAAAKGFKLQTHELELFGICAACQG